MCKTMIVAAFLMLCGMPGSAQHSPEEAYRMLLRLTASFSGAAPYSCDAIVQVSYNSSAKGALTDTSALIYQGRSTYYRSRLVERVEAPQGELIINHQLKTASFYIADSVKQVLQKDLRVPVNKELESVMDSNVAQGELEAFHSFLVGECNMAWNAKGGLEEIAFTPKNPRQATLLMVKIRFDQYSKVRYYEYTSRDFYATDWHGNSRFRIVKTIYDHFKHEQVPHIPSKLNDFLAWNGWKIKLIKYTNYKLSVL